MEPSVCWTQSKRVNLKPSQEKWSVDHQYIQWCSMQLIGVSHATDQEKNWDFRK